MSNFPPDYRPFLRGLNGTFRRYLYDRIAWDRRVVGIIGAPGSGKTTLLLQRIKLQFGESDKACYLSLDDMRFLGHALTPVVTAFCKKGGTHLFLDQVQAYPGWKKECARWLAAFPQLHIVWAASPAVQPVALEENTDAERDCYRLHTLSFREYLSYESVLDMPPIPLDEVVARHAAWVKEIHNQVNIAPLFRNYLEHGCYPFYWQDPAAFSERLQCYVRQTLEIDLAAAAGLSQTGVGRIKKLLAEVAASTPFLSLSSELARLTGVPYGQLASYLSRLEQLGYLHIKNASPVSLSEAGADSANSPSDPDTVSGEKRLFLGNPNLLAALSTRESDRRLLAATFFVDQLSAVGEVQWLGKDDFRVNDRYTFRVGDLLGAYDSLKEKEHTFAAVYGLSRSFVNRMPLWLLGFCY